ncbi:MAG: Hsp20 family protein [Rhodobacteraceae bacterium]|nr:Hsp20 family protein [Paracoccaceae bacterium]
MRNFDFTPLYRTSIGFDRLANLMDTVSRTDNGGSGYPPYNIEKTAEDAYRITIAVAGFAEDELNIEARDGQLVISGKKVEVETDTAYLHQGIANRAFEKRFQLADHVRATDATTENGLLHVDLVREVPEALKPRRIKIATGRSVEAEKITVEGQGPS